MRSEPSPFAGPPSPALLDAFGRTISQPRWRTYLVAAGFRADVAHALYLWNATVGESFRFPLQVAAVALRNVVNDALVATFGIDWWRDPAARRHLGADRCADVDRAAARIRDRYGAEPETGRIVASLMLGFWSAMLRPPIGRDLSGDYGAILRLTGWICPLTKAWVAGNAKVPAILRQRPR